MSDIDVPKLPFNDYKHIPSRPEIDMVLGMESAILLRRFEELLKNEDHLVNWSFHWYDEGGWGYRASWGNRVLCILNFYRGYYAVTLGVPLDKEDQFLELKILNDKLRAQFTNYKLSPKMKWMDFNIRTKSDAEGAAALVALKLKNLKEKAKK